MPTEPRDMTPLEARSGGLKYTTYDFVVMAFLAAIAAVVYAGLAQVWTAITAATGPLGGAFLGLFQFGHLIAFAVLRKPGVTFTTSFLTTVGQLLIGDPAGAYVLGWGVFHGLGAEAVFFSRRYKSANALTLCIAGGVAAVLGQVYSYWVFGWQGVKWMFYVSLPILFISSAVESGLLAYWVARALEKVRGRKGSTSGS